MASKNIGKNAAAVELGRLGGLAGRGASKARSSEQARANINVRWARVRVAKQAKACGKETC